MKKEEILDFYLQKEKSSLGEFGLNSDNNFFAKREYASDDKDYRLEFQRDRDRIIHSRAFRRLMHKTQVFNANKGDHYRNRLTHTMEVNQIARSIGKLLDLNDELIEAIAIGHDIGHTPFGHVGERTLHEIISGRIGKYESEFPQNNNGGFKHNYQSLQLSDNIEKRTDNYQGLNLTFAVREGIFKHTSSKLKVSTGEKEEVKYSSLDLKNMKVGQCSMTLEGQVVAIADEIAQCTHDLEDGIRAKIITTQDLEKNNLIQNLDCDLKDLKETVDVRNGLIRKLVGHLIIDVYENTNTNLKELKSKNKIPQYKNFEDSYNTQIVDFSDETKKLQKELSTFITRVVIASQEVTQSDRKSEYIIKKLFKAYYQYPQQLPDYILRRYYLKAGFDFDRIKIGSDIKNLQNDSEFIRLICDHISSMTDQYASREYRKLYEPEYY